MRILRNTLYVTLSNGYLSLDGENVVILCREDTVGRVPLHNLEGIVTFGYTGASPALMRACCKKDIALSFLSPSGKFLGRVSGEQRGNVLVRRKQYRIADDISQRLPIARSMIAAKIFNSRWVVERALRDHALRVDGERLKKVSNQLALNSKRALLAENDEILRGIEGESAKAYFSVFDELILQQKEHFRFETRNRRPPRDPVNALLSFAYTLLMHEVSAALETVGIDPYVGFFHTDRPGRSSLALDMMEELRAPIADRFVLTLINKKIINISDFIIKEAGAVVLKDDARKTVLSMWQKRKQEVINHPFLEEKLEWGLVPYAQALLLSRFIRDDLDGYPASLWK